MRSQGVVYISLNTVKTHTKAVYRKLGATCLRSRGGGCGPGSRPALAAPGTGPPPPGIPGSYHLHQVGDERVCGYLRLGTRDDRQELAQGAWRHGTTLRLSTNLAPSDGRSFDVR